MSETNGVNNQQIMIRTHEATNGSILWSDHQTTCDGDVVYQTSNDDGNRNYVGEGDISLFHGAIERKTAGEKEQHGRSNHVRSLSGHFQDSIKLSDPADDMKNGGGYKQEKNTMYSTVTPYPTQESRGGTTATKNIVGQKHRRVFSGGITNPHTSHRRLDSNGYTEFIDKCSVNGQNTHRRHYTNNSNNKLSSSLSSSSSSSTSNSRSSLPHLEHPKQQIYGRRHRRSDSAGLDLLSVAANVSQDKNERTEDRGGIGDTLRWNQPSSELRHVNTSHEEDLKIGAENHIQWNRANLGTRKIVSCGRQLPRAQEYTSIESHVHGNNINNSTCNRNSNHSEYELSELGNYDYAQTKGNNYHFRTSQRQHSYRQESFPHRFAGSPLDIPPRHHHSAPYIKTGNNSYYPSSSPVNNYPRQSYLPPPRHVTESTMSSKQSPYPVQQHVYPPRSNRRNHDRNMNTSSAGPPEHPLADPNTRYADHTQHHNIDTQYNPQLEHPPFGCYRRETSFSSVGSDKIETDEALFSHLNESRINDYDGMPPPSRIPTIRSSSPMISRASPKLFAQYLSCSNASDDSTGNNGVEKEGVPPPSCTSSFRTQSPVIPRVSPKLFAQYIRCSPTDLQTTPHPPLEVGEVFVSDSTPTTTNVNHASTSVSPTTAAYDPMNMLTFSPSPKPDAVESKNAREKVTSGGVDRDDTCSLTLDTTDESSLGVVPPLTKVENSYTPSPPPLISPTSTATNATTAILCSTLPPPPESWSPSSGSDSTTTTRNQSNPQSNSKPRHTATTSVPARRRRKCSVADCQNRVVQGGVCIAHGAKRKICDHPGCNKHVKKAGKCSAHGPARKRCDVDGCQKVAVQGGRCIGHGAKKKLCNVDSCGKQAIFGGMCKRHNDESGVVESIDGGSRGGKGRDTADDRHHRRGLSFFQDMSTVNTIINSSQDRSTCGLVDHKTQCSPCPQDEKKKATHKRGLSLFSEKEVQEKIIQNVIRI